jgi:cytochrome bd-type quinol oxidase subunit 2
MKKNINRLMQWWKYVDKPTVITVLAIAFSVVTMVGLLWIAYDTNSRQAKIAENYATIHNMTLVSCIDASGYKECSFSNRTTMVLVKISDSEPDKVFSVSLTQNIQ